MLKNTNVNEWVLIVTLFLHFRYFLICVNYFFYGETVADYFGALVQREEPLQFLVRYHRFISFALYLAGELDKSDKTRLPSLTMKNLNVISQKKKPACPL